MARATDGLTAAERFFSKIVIDKGCEIFPWSVYKGIGRFNLRVDDPELLVFGNKGVNAPLFAWYLKTGHRVKTLWHTCNNSLCVKPSHLFAPETPQDFFLWHVTKLAPDCNPWPKGCFNWTAGTSSTGYGSWWFPTRFENPWGIASDAAHRWAYRLFVGPIPEGMQVLHGCDNRLCVNTEDPANHLHLGTQQQNILEMQERGRARYARAERIACSQFTNEQARLIRQLNGRGVSPEDIATLMNADLAAIQRVRLNRTYMVYDAFDDNNRPDNILIATVVVH
jgi:hypothetical protein